MTVFRKTSPRTVGWQGGEQETHKGKEKKDALQELEICWAAIPATHQSLPAAVLPRLSATQRASVQLRVEQSEGKRARKDEQSLLTTKATPEKVKVAVHSCEHGYW
jgi:hypothetical protein